MEIAGYEFTGPVTDATKIPLDGSGVYVVVCLVDGDVHCCLDVGKARQLGDRLRSHNRRGCWEEHVHGEIAYCYKITSGTWDRDLEADPITHSPGGSRSQMAGTTSELQWKLDCPCGRNPWREIEEYVERYREYENEFGPRGSVSLE